MDKRRVKYFDVTDLAASFYVEQSKQVVANLDSQTSLSNINDAIELFLINKYIETNIPLGFPINSSTLISKCTGNYLRTLVSVSLLDLYENIEEEYHFEFWEFFTKYRLYANFDEQSFLSFIHSRKPDIRNILPNEKLVNAYDEVLKQYFLEDLYNAILLIENYEIDNINNCKKMFFPKSLTLDNKEKLIIEYIESERPNIRYLEIISTIRNRDEIRISDKTKLLAKRRLEKETEIFFQNNSGHTTGVSIAYSATQEEFCIYTQDEGITHLSYSYNWIKDNLDFNTLLNNFIYLFEFIDEQARITLTSKSSDIGAIERCFLTWAKNNYPTGWSFQHKEHISDLQLYSYVNLLNSFEINIEDIIQWFFKKYLADEFNITCYDVNITSKNTTYLEKCRILAPEIESILKKFNMLVEDGFIDQDLLEIASTPLSFSNCKSFFPIKYVYSNSSDFNTVCYFLFSDQSMLNYLEKEERSYNSFFEILRTRKVKIGDYHGYQQKNINWLISNGYIKLDKDNNLAFKDIRLIWILRELYQNEVITYTNCHKDLQIFIDSLLEKDYLKSGSSLFSESEQHFYNYYLNKSEYGNSLDIRNSYVHGSQPKNGEEQQKHKYHYIVILKLLILIVLKINDELCNKNLTTASTGHCY